jgi:hypothetical protein
LALVKGIACPQPARIPVVTAMPPETQPLLETVIKANMTLDFDP